MKLLSVTLVMSTVLLAACGQDVAAPDRNDETPQDEAQASAGQAATPDATAAQQDEGTSPRAVELQSRATVALSGGEDGHLVDASGAALYMLEGNLGGAKCDAECEVAWPPAVTQGSAPTPGPGIQPQLLTSLPRPGGGSHVTYGNQPLYRYAGDGGAGGTAGDGVKDKWGTWHLVSSSGTAVTQRAR